MDKTDTRNITVAFRNFMKAPRTTLYSLKQSYGTSLHIKNAMYRVKVLCMWVSSVGCFEFVCCHS